MTDKAFTQQMRRHLAIGWRMA